MTQKIVVASGNKHKLEEIKAALDVEKFEFVSIYDVVPNWPSPEENGDTFEANAAIKAMAAFDASGLPALADDSGLVVDALDGEPGVYSARYAGEEATDEQNNEKLLKNLADVTLADSTARFVSCLVLVGLDQYFENASAYISVEGTVEGIMAKSGRGEHGFGYDPLFLPYATPGKTMAELTMDEKNEISHRGNALSKLVEVLKRENIIS